jgi:hypothetical protein
VDAIQKYIDSLSEERRTALSKLRGHISGSIPAGFEECIQYGMISYVVPHTLYPAGYHCNSSKALPFIQIASQKNHIALYHMGIYANPELLEWFITEYSKHSTAKPDIGKSCIRFKNVVSIPYALIEGLSAKITVDEWIRMYEQIIKK